MKLSELLACLKNPQLPDDSLGQTDPEVEFYTEECLIDILSVYWNKGVICIELD